MAWIFVTPMEGVILQKVHGACKWDEEVRMSELDGFHEVMRYIYVGDV